MRHRLFLLNYGLQGQNATLRPATATFRRWLHIHPKSNNQRLCLLYPWRYAPPWCAGIFMPTRWPGRPIARQWSGRNPSTNATTFWVDISQGLSDV